MAAVKRAAPEPEDLQPTKKIKHHSLKHVQQGFENGTWIPEGAEFAQQELTKFIAVALHDAGFDSIKESALESFRMLVDEYMQHFLLYVKESMQHSRRVQTLPQDFIFALARSNLTASSLSPVLELATPPEIAQPPLSPPLLPDLAPFDIPSDLIDSSTKTRQDLKVIVPQHFPQLPSQHAYKTTEVSMERETDAFKIRERATQEGMLAEQALRKLVAASKAGTRRKLQRERRSAEKRRGDELWKKAMEEMVKLDKDDSKRKPELGDAAMFGFDGAVENDPTQILDSDLDNGAVVNYGRQFWRRTAIRH